MAMTWPNAGNTVLCEGFEKRDAELANRDAQLSWAKNWFASRRSSEPNFFDSESTTRELVRGVAICTRITLLARPHAFRPASAADTIRLTYSHYQTEVTTMKKTMTGGAFSALLATIAVAVAPLAAATPPLPASPAITPGAGLVSTNAAGSEGTTCTAGWLARDSAGREVMLSAGHCTRGGAVSIKYSVTGAYEKIGAFSSAVNEGAFGADRDFGVIALDSAIPVDTRILDRRPVVGATSKVAVGDVLCKYGSLTQRRCGPVTEVTPSEVVFATAGEGGDSGGPVYLIRPDGNAVAVGVTVRGDSEISAAELIEPWLRDMRLTLDTRPSPTAQRAAFGR